MRFLLVGFFNTIFGYLVFAALIVIGTGYSVALFLATVAGVALNFQTSQRLVFRAPGRALQFCVLYAATFALNWLLLRGLLRAGASELFGQAVLVLPMAATSFVGQRLFVFPVRRLAANVATYEPVMPLLQHRSNAEHWVLVDGWALTTWRQLRWDQASRTWRSGRRAITPEQAAQGRWRYAGPVVRAVDLPLSAGKPVTVTDSTER